MENMNLNFDLTKKLEKINNENDPDRTISESEGMDVDFSNGELVDVPIQKIKEIEKKLANQYLNLYSNMLKYFYLKAKINTPKVSGVSYYNVWKLDLGLNCDGCRKSLCIIKKNQIFVSEFFRFGEDIKKIVEKTIEKLKESRLFDVCNEHYGRRDFSILKYSGEGTNTFTYCFCTCFKWEGSVRLIEKILRDLYEVCKCKDKRAIFVGIGDTINIFA